MVVLAADDSSITIITGGVGIGIAGAGIGASVGIGIFDKTTDALIGANAVINAKGIGTGYDDILTAYPHLTRDQVQAAVTFASELFKEERFVATAKVHG